MSYKIKPVYEITSVGEDEDCNIFLTVREDIEGYGCVEIVNNNGPESDIFDGPIDPALAQEIAYAILRVVRDMESQQTAENSKSI
jgi:hypothetical protein